MNQKLRISGKIMGLSLFILLNISAVAFAGESKEIIGRIMHSEKRGILNLVSFPVEIPKQAINESKRYKWIWPVSFIPRSMTNMLYRLTSGVYDMAFYPFRAPFTDDESALTRGIGLPDYVWQKDEDL